MLEKNCVYWNKCSIVTTVGQFWQELIQFFLDFFAIVLKKFFLGMFQLSIIEKKKVPFDKNIDPN